MQYIDKEAIVADIVPSKTKEVDLKEEVNRWIKKNENIIHTEFAKYFFELGVKAMEDKK